MEINYNSRNFPNHLGPLFRGNNNIIFSPQELFWSAITVGRANFIDVISNGIYSEYEILYRASIIAANIAQTGSILVKSSAYNSLDPSEKGAVSYFLGLTFCKLLSNKLLKIPWLLHIDVYRNQFTRAGQAFGYGSSRVRPDMIGLDTRRRWTVMESKGRTNTFTQELLVHAKNQTRNLRKIGTDYPNLRVAVVTHFTNGPLTVDWEDPEGYNDDYFDLDTTADDYLLNYYKLIVSILSNNQTIEIAGFTLYTFTNISLTVGLDSRILEAYNSGKFSNIRAFETTQSQQFTELPNQNFYAGPDGIIVGLGSNWQAIILSNEK